MTKSETKEIEIKLESINLIIDRILEKLNKLNEASNKNESKK